MALSKDDILQLSFGKKLIGLLVVLVIIAGLYVYLMFLPKQKELAEKDREIETLLNQKQEKQTIADNLDEFKQLSEKLNLQLEEVKKLLPSQKEIPDLLFSISSLVESSGLELDIFEPLPEVATQDYAEVPVNVKVNGEFTQLATFLDKVGKLPRIVNVTDLKISKVGEKADATTLTATGKVTTYRFIGSPPAAAASAAPAPKAGAAAKAKGGGEGGEE